VAGWMEKGFRREKNGKKSPFSLMGRSIIRYAKKGKNLESINELVSKYHYYNVEFQFRMTIKLEWCSA